MISQSQQMLPAQALATVLKRIEEARASAVAPAPFTTLVAVTKTHGADWIRPVLVAGHRTFGENRVQEAKAKWSPLREEFPDVELHLIGPLQTNKVREALDLFDVIQTLDRPKLARAIAAEGASAGRTPRVFVQVNTGEESQKAGVIPHEAPKFIRFCLDELKLPVQGLMCIPPLMDAPAPHFALLRKLARTFALPYLSMGMTADFETAIKFGATHVRVGTAIFGEREV